MQVCFSKFITEKPCLLFEKVSMLKELRWVTGGIFYCRESAKMKFFAANKTLYQLDNDVPRNRQQNIPPNR